MALRVDNCLIVDVKGIRDLTFNKFKEKFKETYFRHPGLDKMDFKSLTPSESNELMLPFSMKEIKEAIWNTVWDKVPGLDGFTMSFYKASWHIICNDLHDCNNDFITKAHLPKVFATDFITS